MPRNFDRKTASPTESAVTLGQAIREHSGADILNLFADSRNIRLTFVTCQEWSIGFFCMEPISMRVVPRSMMHYTLQKALGIQAFLVEYDVPSRSM